MFNFSKSSNTPPAEKPTLKKDVVIMDYLKNLEKDIGNFNALYIKISKLENPNLKTVQKQGLLDTFDNITRKNNGEIFSLPNDDLVVVYRAIAKEEIQACIIKIRFILHDDKLIKDNFDLEAAGFLKFFELRSDLAEFQELVAEEANRQTIARQEKTTAVQSREPRMRQMTSAPSKPKKELTPYMLGKLTKTLSMADFSSLIRRQAICAVIGKSAPQMLFEEVYVSIADLRDTLLPDVDLTANPWLFQYLTETLDKRVLASISNHDDGSLTSNFSLNLNVSTVLSDEFLEFDEDINASMRSTIVLELQLLDIFSDVKAFILAKTFAQSRGYKICIDGITVDKLKYLNREQLDADLIKIIWHPTFMDVIHEDKHFMDYVNKAERAKMILCRVDEPQAVEVGNSLGINLYQGRYIQRMLSRRSSKQTIFTIRR